MKGDSMTRNFIILSGGPGLYESRDPQSHDTSWSNYVDNLLLLSRTNKFTRASDEKITWFVYLPAYESRWIDDKAKNRTSVKNVIAKGFTSYKDMIEKRASSYGYTLVWITEAMDFGRKIQNFPDNSISRLYYFGHASSSLWLSLKHSCTGSGSNVQCVAVMPNSTKEVLYPSQILPIYVKKFQPGGPAYDTNKSSKIFGCNTADFAKKLADVLKIYTEGCVGKINFETAPSNGGSLVSLSGSCGSWKKFKPGGSEI
jgi:hypothetical protein